MINLWNKSHLATGDLPASSWQKLMSGELKQLLFSSSSLNLFLIFSPVHVLTRPPKPIPESFQSFTFSTPKLSLWTMFVSRFFTSVEDTLLSSSSAVSVCLGECASQPLPAWQHNRKCWHWTSLQRHGTCVSDYVGWMTCVETEWVRWDSLRHRINIAKRWNTNRYKLGLLLQAKRLN